MLLVNVSMSFLDKKKYYTFKIFKNILIYYIVVNI